MDDSSLMSFKAIASFVTDLNEVFGKRQKSLALYARLIEKTGITNEKPILKHIDAFRSVCIANREALQTQDKSKLADVQISYSDRVYIDLKHIFNMAEKEPETIPIIWKHLLTISALLDPSSNAKKILKENVDKSKIIGGDSKEEKFLSSLIDKVEQSINPDELNGNPMSAISSIMSSGVITDLIGNMQSGLSNGDLDLNKLMGTVQGMMSKMGGMPGGNGGMGGMPDLSSMMNMMGPMMTGMGGMGGMMNNGPIGNLPSIQSIEEEDEKDS